MITGNQPDRSKFPSYPSWLFFDGKPTLNYSADERKKIALFSDNFKNYSKWEGEDVLNKSDRKKIKRAVKQAHKFQLPIRFWNAPDNEKSWKELIRLKVDYLNTDRIGDISKFLGRD